MRTLKLKISSQDWMHMVADEFELGRALLEDHPRAEVIDDMIVVVLWTHCMVTTECPRDIQETGHILRHCH